MAEMSRSLLSLGVVALLSGLAGHAGAIPISITNPGFESPVLADGTFSATPPTGWTASASGPGAFNPSTAHFSGVPEGQNILYSFGAPVSQTLSDVLAANTTYTLTVWVGDRLGVVFPGYNVRLLAGATILSDCDTCVTPGMDGTFALVTLIYSSGASHPQLGQPLGIVFDSDGTQTAWDYVQLDAVLDAVPEPSTLSLLGSGLGAMVAGRWRRRGR